ncbi:hypothetical protein BH24ACT15_BH24ACT15_06360 [soil metagenome]
MAAYKLYRLVVAAEASTNEAATATARAHDQSELAVGRQREGGVEGRASAQPKPQQPSIVVVVRNPAR